MDGSVLIGCRAPRFRPAVVWNVVALKARRPHGAPSDRKSGDDAGRTIHNIRPPRSTRIYGEGHRGVEALRPWLVATAAE